MWGCRSTLCRSSCQQPSRSSSYRNCPPRPLYFLYSVIAGPSLWAMAGRSSRGRRPPGSRSPRATGPRTKISDRNSETKLNERAVLACCAPRIGSGCCWWASERASDSAKQLPGSLLLLQPPLTMVSSSTAAAVADAAAAAGKREPDEEESLPGQAKSLSLKPSLPRPRRLLRFLRFLPSGRSMKTTTTTTAARRIRVAKTGSSEAQEGSVTSPADDNNNTCSSPLTCPSTK